MTLNQISPEVEQKKIGKGNADDLGYLLYHCWDLPLLQTSRLARLPRLLNRAKEEKQGLELAKALRKELIACAEQITQRPRYSIEEIVTAIEKGSFSPVGQEVQKIRKLIGVPFPRNKLDLARYYTIRLVMQGIDQPTIAEFLDVDLRTVANYVSQAKDRIRVVLETRALQV
jgi:hypothetical protein